MTTLQRTATAAEIATPRRQLGTIVWKWMVTTDHKVIGNLYFITSMMFFLFGGILAMAMRAEFAWPGMQFLSYETFNQFFTMHGTIMLLLFATPLFAGFANAIMPLQIGAPDVAFPRLNMIAYWFYLFGGLIASAGFLSPSGAASFGWFAYAPLNDAVNSPGVGGDLWIMGLVHGWSRHHSRRSQLHHHDPVYACAWHDHVPAVHLHMEHSGDLVLGVGGLPDSRRGTLGAGGRWALGAQIFNPANGGPILWQHLYGSSGTQRFTSLPFPFFGIITEVLPVFSRKPIFGYSAWSWPPC